MTDDFKVCNHCGQVIPPNDIRLSPQLRLIYNSVKKHPRTAEQLRMILWGHRSDGGAKCRSTIFSLIYHLNKRLASKGLKVSSGGYWDAAYRIIELNRRP